MDHILHKIQHHTRPDTPLAVIYGYKRAQIKDYLEAKYARCFAISYIDQIPRGYQGDVPYFGGLGEAILLTYDWWKKTPHEKGASGNPITIVFLGDMIPVQDYSSIMEDMAKPNVDGIIGAMKVSVDRCRFYGMIEADAQHRIQKMVEKPPQSSSTLAIAGVYAFNERTMSRLYEILSDQYGAFRKIQKNSRMEFQFTPALQQLVEEGSHLEYSVFEHGILDFGQPDSLLSGNKILLDAHKNTIEGAVAEIRDSVIRNPSSIGNNSRLLRSVIGPFVSVGENCVLENCNLENVVIGDNCHLQGVISRDSIIGDGAKVQNIIKDNMYLGDNSTVVESDLL